MAVSRSMRRLVRILHMQEEQSRNALEAAVAALRRLEQAQQATRERGRAGRRLVAASALESQMARQLADRLAGLEETLAASRMAALLAAPAADAQQSVVLRREEFLARRIERRQAEALVKNAEAADAVAAGRAGQRALDDWYLNRLRTAGRDREKGPQ